MNLRLKCTFLGHHYKPIGKSNDGAHHVLNCIRCPSRITIPLEDIEYQQYKLKHPRPRKVTFLPELDAESEAFNELPKYKQVLFKALKIKKPSEE